MNRYLPLLVLLVTATAFGQHVSEAPTGPIYNGKGQVIANRHADGTAETYRYSSTGERTGLADEAGSLRNNNSESGMSAGNYHKKRKPTPTPEPTPTPVVTPTPTPTPAATPTPSGTPPDSTLETNYSVSKTTVGWVVCGSLPGSSGCYSSGSFGPFGQIGAIVEGNRVVDASTNSVTRNIYILDVATGTTANGVTLYVYKRTDRINISTSTDSVITSLVTSINLPLTGGTSALASMAGNDKILAIGTNQSPSAVVMQKSDFSFIPLGGFSPPINVAAITTDEYGYITITYGSFNSSPNAFIDLDPNGQTTEDGGGADFLLNKDQAVLPATLP